MKERVFYTLIIYKYFLCETYSWKKVCFRGFFNYSEFKRGGRIIVGVDSTGNNYNGYILQWLRLKNSDYGLYSFESFAKQKTVEMAELFEGGEV